MYIPPRRYYRQLPIVSGHDLTSLTPSVFSTKCTHTPSHQVQCGQPGQKRMLSLSWVPLDTTCLQANFELIWLWDLKGCALDVDTEQTGLVPLNDYRTDCWPLGGTAMSRGGEEGGEKPQNKTIPTFLQVLWGTCLKLWQCQFFNH